MEFQITDDSIYHSIHWIKLMILNFFSIYFIYFFLNEFGGLFSCFLMKL